MKQIRNNQKGLELLEDREGVRFRFEILEAEDGGVCIRSQESRVQGPIKSVWIPVDAEGLRRIRDHIDLRLGEWREG